MVDDAEMVWEKVCCLQTESGISYAEISKKSGVPLTTVKRFFRGETKNPGFFQVCQIINALGGSVDDLLELGDRPQTVTYSPTDERFCQQLLKDLSYERQLRRRSMIAFVILCALVMLMMMLDIISPQLGYIRYQAYSSAVEQGSLAADFVRQFAQI